MAPRKTSRPKRDPAVTAGEQQPVGAPSSPVPVALPHRAWIIVGLHWEFNDEFSIPAGESTGDKVYFDEQAAQDACRALTDAFFQETPGEFGVCWDEFDLDPEVATWDDLRRAGFPEPFFLKELES